MLIIDQVQWEDADYADRGVAGGDLSEQAGRPEGGRWSEGGTASLPDRVQGLPSTAQGGRVHQVSVHLTGSLNHHPPPPTLLIDWL